MIDGSSNGEVWNRKKNEGKGDRGGHVKKY
jgi:hypothetical protein